jgi:cardiolipin synthase
VPKRKLDKKVIIDLSMLDYFQLDFEVNAVVFDKKEAKKMVRIFKQDIMHCTKITKKEYEKRNLKIRFKEQACRLLSPIL